MDFLLDINMGGEFMLVVACLVLITIFIIKIYLRVDDIHKKIVGKDEF